MTESEENISRAIEGYLKKIIYEDMKSGVSRFYTELSAELSADNILPVTLCVHDRKENEQREFEVFELVEKEKNLIISGVSGSGKTTTLRWLNVICAKKVNEDKNCSIPVYVELNSYINGTFYDHVKRNLNEKGVKEPVFRSMLNNNLIFLIDGLDLISSSDSFPATHEILNFASDHSGCRYVISSRPGYFEEFKDRFIVSELEELNDEKMGLFIKKYVIDEKLSVSLKNNILNDEKLKSLFKNPLMLLFGIKVADIRRNDKNEIIHAALPTSPSKMYEDFITYIFNHFRKKGKPLHADEVQIRETLADIYFKLQCKNMVSCEYRYALQVAEKHVDERRFSEKTAQNILEDIFKLGLLSKSDSTVNYGVHQSFQEYFAAFKLVDCFNKGMDISQVFTHPKWENIVIFATDMFDCPDELIRSMMVSGNLDIASKCTKKASLHIKEELCFLIADGLDSKFVQERINSVESIARLGDVGVSLLIAMLRDEHDEVRWKAASVLGSIKSEKSVDVLNVVLCDKNDEMRSRVAFVLGSIKSEKSVDVLIAALCDKNDTVRKSAATALGSIKSEKSVDALIAALCDKNYVVQSTAATALGSIKSEKSVDALIAALRDENEYVHRSAADALGSIKSEKSVDALIAALSDENEYVRRMAVNALIYIESKKLVDALIAALHDENDEVRSTAAAALGSIKSEKSVDALIAALSDKNDEVRSKAVNALCSIKSEKSVDALIAALSDKNDYVRGRVAVALGSIKSEKSVDALIAALRDENDEVRWKAADALGSIKSEKAIDQLIAALHDKNDEVCRRAVNALGSIKSEKSVDALIAVLHDENDEVRSMAADALGSIRSEKAIDQLIAALRDENYHVLRSAAAALGSIKSEKSVDALIAALHDENDEVRKRAVDALGSIRSEKAIDQLIAALHDKNDDVRWKTASVLGTIKSEKSVDALIAGLRDEYYYVRGRVAVELGSIKSEKSVDALIAALHDEYYYVRSRAADALGSIRSEKSVDALIAALRDENDEVRSKASDALSSIRSEKSVDALIAALRDEYGAVRRSAADALKKTCTYRHKCILQKLKYSDNEYQANTKYDILNEIEHNENSKIELFQKNPGLREKSDPVSKNKDPFGAHPAEDGMVDPYIGTFVDRIKSIREPVTLIDYGCGQGMLLGAMRSLPKEALENISYIGVDVKTKYLYMTELNSRKYSFYEKFRVEPEFLKPERLYAKNILVDYALMIHTLHELRFVDLVDVIYNITSKLRVGGRFFILEQRKLLEKEMNFVLWDEEDFKMLFLNSGFMSSWRPVETKSGNKLSSIEMEKVRNDCSSREKVAEICLSVYRYKKEKVSKELCRSGISYDEFQQLSMLLSNISIQIYEYENRIKK